MDENSVSVRLTRVEERTAHHSREIMELKNASKEANEWLQRIQKTMDKIFWLGSGCTIAYLANVFGLSDILKAIVL